MDEGVGGDLAALPPSSADLAETSSEKRQRPKLSKLSSFECASLSSCGPSQLMGGGDPAGQPGQIGQPGHPVSAAPSSVADHLTHSLPGVGPMAPGAAAAGGGLAEATSDIVPPVTAVGSSNYLQLPSAGASSLGMPEDRLLNQTFPGSEIRYEI